MAKKKVEKPQEPGAPAYMTQYTSLMMLLLAFFIAIMSKAQFGPQYSGLQQGLGQIRNSFGIQGGFGILPFLSSITKNRTTIYPKVDGRDADNKERNLIGHPKNRVLPNTAITTGFASFKQVDRGQSLRIPAPFAFEAESAALDPDAQDYLRKIGGIMQGVPDAILTVRCYYAPARDLYDGEMLAARRASAIVRFLEAECGVPRARMRAVAYGFDRYLGRLSSAQVRSGQATLLYIHRHRQPPARSAAPSS